MLMYHISMLQGQGLRLSKNTIQRILAEQMGIKAKQEHLWFLSKLNLDRYRLFLQDLVRRFSKDRFLQKLSVEQQFNRSKQSTLKAMEPDYIVQRGFSILRDKTGNIVSSVKVIQKGSIIHASIRDGKIVGTVNSVTGEER